MEQEPRRQSPAPYVAFKTFLTALDTLSQGLPSRLDRSVWPSFSGGVQSQMLSAFRFLRLIDDEGNVQPDLRALVEDGEQRQANLRRMLEARYPNVVALASQHASPVQFEAAMRELGGEGTLRKAIAFFLPAAEYAELAIPQSWKRRRRRGAAAVARRKRGGTGGGTRVPEERHEARKASAGEQGMTKTVRLGSGGTVTLTLSVDLMSMVPADRQWLFELIDKFGSYQQEAAGENSPGRSDEVAVGDN